jgi:hypothetical protein
MRIKKSTNIHLVDLGFSAHLLLRVHESRNGGGILSDGAGLGYEKGWPYDSDEWPHSRRAFRVYALWNGHGCGCGYGYDCGVLNGGQDNRPH